MHILGLHIIDVLIVLGYVIGMLWIGKIISKRIKSTEDFYLGGRKLGKLYQMFLSFGSATNADQAVGVSREIYRQGIGGMWIQYLVLFITPFYWFTTVWFRRVRLVTMGDFYTERFESRFIGGSYAIFVIIIAFFSGAFGYMIAGKTMMALTPKPAIVQTVEEQQSVKEFYEFKGFEKKINEVGLTEEENARFEVLRERNKRGDLHSNISYIKPIYFYLIYGLIVTLYTVMGGFIAAVVTDAFQGVLIVIFSVILIPFGLARIGGFEGLHAKVPDYMFQLFGSAATSEYTWYLVLGMLLSNMVGIISLAPNMAGAGSAKDEMSARIGALTGMFLKRFVMIMWALAGLIAVAMYIGKISDPDIVWGVMTRDLLGVGFIGLMLAAILAANMSSLDAGSVANGALFIKNLYEPLYPGRSEKHYINVSRVIISLTLLGGIVIALWMNNVLVLWKYFISIPAIFGAPVWLGFFWRKLTKSAVISQVILCSIIIIILPNVVPGIKAISRNPYFLKETASKEVTIKTGALEDDVAKGKAEKVGDIIEKNHVIQPVGIFFENVARINPDDPNSPLEGIGRFNAEVFCMSLIGVDFTNYSKGSLETTRFMFIAIFPFVMLFVISIFTKKNSKEALDRFYVRMKTPVYLSPEGEVDLEGDRREVEKSYKDPSRFDHKKMFRNSSWEFTKWDKVDAIGFIVCWLLVGLVIAGLFFITWYQ